MPYYLVTVTNPRGRRSGRLIEADSGNTAVKLALEDGSREPILHTDDLAAYLTDWKPVRKFLSPSQLLALQKRPPLAFLLVLWKVVWKLSPVLLLYALVIVLLRAMGRPWGMWDYILLILPPALLPALLVALLFKARRVAALQQAVAWGRWEEVLSRLRRLGRAARSLSNARYKIAALAGLGRLGEATGELGAFRNEIPAWLYWLLLSDIYTIAHKYDWAIQAGETALEEAPDNATVIINFARTLLIHRLDAGRASQLVEGLRRCAVAENLQSGVSMVKGLLALENGDSRAARDYFEKALAEMGSLRLAPGAIRVEGPIRAYLAIAQERLGDHTAALNQFREVEPFLRSGKADVTLQRCISELRLDPSAS